MTEDESTAESGVAEMTIDQANRLASLKLHGLVHAVASGRVSADEIRERIDGIGETFIEAHFGAGFDEGWLAGQRNGYEKMFKGLVRGGMLRVKTRAGLARALAHEDAELVAQLLAWFDEAQP